MDQYAIEINYSKAKRQAEELEAAAKRLKTLAESGLEASCGTIAANWQGDNADKYIRKVRKVQGDIKTVSQSLQNTADAIRKIAAATYRADMAALAIAKKRNV